jgi:hypothetical protein
LRGPRGRAGGDIQNRIRRGAFKSVAGLEKAIMGYLEQHNANPEPFVWTARPAPYSEKSPARNKRWNR